MTCHVERANEENQTNLRTIKAIGGGESPINISNCANKIYLVLDAS